MTINLYEMACPYCGKPHVETFDADLPMVCDEGVMGDMSWRCPSCGKGGSISYMAAYVRTDICNECGETIVDIKEAE